MRPLRYGLMCRRCCCLWSSPIVGRSELWQRAVPPSCRWISWECQSDDVIYVTQTVIFQNKQQPSWIITLQIGLGWNEGSNNTWMHHEVRINSSINTIWGSTVVWPLESITISLYESAKWNDSSNKKQDYGSVNDKVTGCQMEDNLILNVIQLKCGISYSKN